MLIPADCPDESTQIVVNQLSDSVSVTWDKTKRELHLLFDK